MEQCGRNDGPGAVGVELARQLHMHGGLLVAPRHRERPAKAKLGAGIDGIERDRLARELEGGRGLGRVAQNAGMGDMGHVVHIDEAAISQREFRSVPDGLGEYLGRASPAVRSALVDHLLAAQPAIVDLERDVRFSGQAHQPFDRQLHVQRHGDAVNDPLLDREPAFEVELEPLAPDVDIGVALAQGQHHVYRPPGLIGDGLDRIVGRNGRSPAGVGRLHRPVDDIPLAESHKAGDEMMPKTLDQM